MPSIFSRIVAGEIPSYKVAEDDRCYAFLDINPVAEGHVLCIPKKEVDYIFDLDQEDYLALMSFVKRVAKGLKKAVPCTKVGEAVLGLEVPHAHVHLIPMQTEGDMDFRRPKLKLTPEQMQDLAKRIAEAID